MILLFLLLKTFQPRGNDKSKFFNMAFKRPGCFRTGQICWPHHLRKTPDLSKCCAFCRKLFVSAVINNSLLVIFFASIRLIIRRAEPCPFRSHLRCSVNMECIGKKTLRIHNKGEETPFRTLWKTDLSLTLWSVLG